MFASSRITQGVRQHARRRPPTSLSCRSKSSIRSCISSYPPFMSDLNNKARYDQFFNSDRSIRQISGTRQLVKEYHTSSSNHPTDSRILPVGIQGSRLYHQNLAGIMKKELTEVKAMRRQRQNPLNSDVQSKRLAQHFKSLSETDRQAAIQYLSVALDNELCHHLESLQKNHRKQYRHSNSQSNMNVTRSFSSSSGSGSDEEEKSDKQRKEQEVVDKDFAEYLTGAKDDVNIAVNELETENSSAAKEKMISTNTSSKESDLSDEQSQSTDDDWFNSLLSNRADLGRPKPEVNEAYRKTERANVKNIEKSRTLQIKTVRRALVGNVVIAGSKLAAFLHSGSSAMLSEFIHSVVDCGNQSLLLVGLRDSGNEADRAHPYGYGKSVYFWALVSALGTFFLGAGVSMTQSIPNLIYGHSLEDITWHVWGVLGMSFAVDGYVFTKTLMEVSETKPEGTSLLNHVRNLRDPATLAILLEDGAACLGVLIAIGGIGATQYYQMPVFDALAGVGISGLLASMGLILVKVNHKFLLGQSVDKDIRKGVEKILMERRSIDNVHSVQSQWTGPDTFSFKAEVDFDGTFLAAKLMPRYQSEFAQASATLDQDLRVLLSWYAEDVMRTVEREVRNIENEIRREYPGAQYIELEPMSKDADRLAIDDGLEASLKRIEIEALNRYLRSLYQPADSSSKLTNTSEDEKDV